MSPIIIATCSILIAVAYAVSTSAFEIDTAVFDYANTDLFLYLNGALDASNTSYQSATSTSNTASNNSQIGSNNAQNQFGNIEAGELLVFHSAHSAAVRNQVWGYLRRKWGL